MDPSSAADHVVTSTKYDCVVRGGAFQGQFHAIPPHIARSGSITPDQMLEASSETGITNNSIGSSLRD